MRHILTLLAGIFFGAGVTISGMVDPMKVLNFMDFAGTWDPSLIFVMGAGLIVTFIGYRVILARERPLFDDTFHLPGMKLIDMRLIVGAILFGLGWGLSGLCPGPAIAGLVFGYTESFAFVGAMAMAMWVTRLALARNAS